MFPVLVKELEQAKHYIYIEYFIINDGVMWRTILDILEKNSRRRRGRPYHLRRFRLSYHTSPQI